MKKLIGISLLLGNMLLLKAQPTVFGITEPGLKAHDSYGWSVALSDSFAIISAARADEEGIDDGTVWAYRVQDKKLVGGRKLICPNHQVAGHFGSKVVLDGHHMLVSAYGMNDKGAQAGAVYYYHYDGTDWNYMQTLYANDIAPNDKFGYGLALHGNIAVISSPGREESGHQGKAYVFRLNSSLVWTQEQVLHTSSVNVYQAYGWDVAIYNDLVAVSALYGSGANPQSGKVFLYRYNGSDWTLEEDVYSTDGNTLDMFGYSLALSGNTLAVGAYKNAGLGDENKKTGAVYVFKKISGTWRQQNKFTGDAASNHHDNFGIAVSLDENLLAVGANQDDFSGKNAGAVYIFKLSGNSWSQVNKLVSSEVNDHDHFGLSVALYKYTLLAGVRLAENDSSRKDHGKAFYYTAVDTPEILDIDQLSNSGTSGSRVNCFPNPFGEQLKIQVYTKEEVEKVALYDIQGKLLNVLKASETTAPGEWLYLLDTPLSPGVYILNIKMSNHSRNVKVIRE